MPAVRPGSRQARPTGAPLESAMRHHHRPVAGSSRGIGEHLPGRNNLMHERSMRCAIPRGRFAGRPQSQHFGQSLVGDRRHRLPECDQASSRTGGTLGAQDLHPCARREAGRCDGARARMRHHGCAGRNALRARFGRRIGPLQRGNACIAAPAGPTGSAARNATTRTPCSQVSTAQRSPGRAIPGMFVRSTC